MESVCSHYELRTHKESPKIQNSIRIGMHEIVFGQLMVGLVQGQEILDDKDLPWLSLVLDDWRNKKFQEISTCFLTEFRFLITNSNKYQKLGLKR